jgi:hypothetical protein
MQEEKIGSEYIAFMPRDRSRHANVREVRPMGMSAWDRVRKCGEPIEVYLPSPSPQEVRHFSDARSMSFVGGNDMLAA